MGTTPGNVFLSLAQGEHEGGESKTGEKTSTPAKEAKEGGAETKSGEGGHSTASAGEATAGEAGHSTTATTEVKNPILPVNPELVWGGITFVLLWALMKFVLLKPVVAGMEARKEKIRGDIQAADDAKARADAAKADYQASLASARAEATRIIEDARAAGEAQRRELIAAADAEVAAMRAAAADEIAGAKAEAMTRISGDVASIAVGAAGAVVGKQLDVDAHRATVDQYLSRTGSSN